jgi:signal peptidase II
VIETMDVSKEETDQAVADCSPGVRGKAERPDRTAHGIFWSILLLGCLLDLWTKRTVFAWLGVGGGTEILDGFLAFRTALNTGAAFGIAAGRQVFLVGVSLVALVVILSFFFWGGVKQRIVQMALGLFAAGVSGNLWDRLFNGGQVRDFIDVVYWPGRHWHTFNVADTMLCIAVVLLVAGTFFTDSSARRRAQPQK